MKMNLRVRKCLFAVVWLLLLAMAPITVTQNLSFQEAFEDPVLLTNFLQRITGLLAFTLISVQIILGHWMNKWTQLIGAKAFRWHIFQGVFIYLLVLFHPFLYSVITFQTSNDILNSVLVFLPSLKNQSEIYLTLGKLSFLLITITVIAGYFRTKPFFRRNWLKLHILNYFIFYAIYLHMRVGSDIMTPLFIWLSWIFLTLVTLSALKRFLLPFTKKFSFKNADEINGQKA